MGFFCDGTPRCIRCGLPNQKGWRQKCRAPDATPDKLPAAPRQQRIASTEPCGTCGQSVVVGVVEPGLVRKIAAFADEVAQWKLAGSPVRTQAQVSELLAICCRCPCLLAAGTTDQRCGACGCPVNDTLTVPSLVGLVTSERPNKLAMGTTSCPGCPPDGTPRW